MPTLRQHSCITDQRENCQERGQEVRAEVTPIAGVSSIGNDDLQLAEDGAVLELASPRQVTHLPQ